MNFPSSICKFSFYKYKNMVIYRRREKTCFSSLSSVWEYLFSHFVDVVAILLLYLCSHPQNGTSQLEWTKVHRWVGEGRVWVLMRVEVKTSARTRCTHVALSVPSRVLQPCTPFSTKNKKQSPSFHASTSRLIKSQDPRPHTAVQFEDLVRVLVMSATLSNQHHSLSIWQKRTCKPHPSYVGTKKWKQENKIKIIIKQK